MAVCRRPYHSGARPVVFGGVAERARSRPDAWPRDAREEGGAGLVSHVAIVTDSVSDLPPELGALQNITVVSLTVTFGAESFRVNVDLTTDQFWERMTAPGAPFPTTAAASPGDFLDAFNAAFERGADAIVTVNCSGELSATLKSAQVARDMLADREIHVVDSRTASMGEGMLAQIAAELAEEGVAAAEIARVIEHRKSQVDLYVALDTLEYLKRGGRISGTRAAVGSMLSIKPIITVREGIVENADRVRTRLKARDRTLELLTASPIERATILHTTRADVDEFHRMFLDRSGLDPSNVQVLTIGASVGPHLGPGCVGAVVVRRH
jgi:DegV family protein with EDD domain